MHKQSFEFCRDDLVNVLEGNDRGLLIETLLKREAAKKFTPQQCLVGKTKEKNQLKVYLDLFAKFRFRQKTSLVQDNHKPQ